ncbi:MAG: FecR domain-containing protein [Pyrinomonadaceae bacterium]
MNKLCFRWMIIAVMAVGLVATVSAQRTTASDKYLISAEAGGVNYTQGQVSVARVNNTGGVLVMGDEIEVGDRVSTGADGRVEILLNPGSYVRLGANSSMEFKTTSLDDLQIQLDSGSAMFEVFATSEFTVSIFTPQGKVSLIESGVYRFDLAGDGVLSVAVTEGKAILGTTTVKEGRVATVSGTKVEVAKFDRGKRDDFAEWSRSRAKELAKTSSTLKNRDVRASLLSAFDSRRWNMFSSYGLWVLDPFTRRFCFLPFGYGWNSPYGFGYGADIWWYNLPPIVFNQPPPPGTPTVKTPPTRVGNPKADTGQSQTASPPYKQIDREREIKYPTRGSEFPADMKPVRDAPSPPPPIIVTPPSAPVSNGKKPDGR